MKPVELSNLKVGMACTKPIHLNPEKIILNSFEPITEELIAQLSQQGVQTVFTEGALVEQELFSAATSSKSEENEEGANLVKNLLSSFKDIEDLLHFLVQAEETLGQLFESVLEEKEIKHENIERLVGEILNKTKTRPELHMIIFHPESEASQQSHSVSVALLCSTLAQHLGLEEVEQRELVSAALLQYLGLIQNEVYIAKKGQNLNPEEKKTLHLHPVQAFKMIQKLFPGSTKVAQLVLHSQEHYDGTGFPQQKAGKSIPDHAMLLHIVDSYVAMTEKKSFREAKLPSVAMKQIVNSASFEYHPLLVKAFLSRFSMYPLGSFVELSNGQYGFVVGFHKEKPLRPTIVVTRDNEKQQLEKLRMINLFYRTGLYIVASHQVEVVDSDYQLEFKFMLENLETINFAG